MVMMLQRGLLLNLRRLYHSERRPILAIQELQPVEATEFEYVAIAC
jgi:hypothetical protein